MILALPAAAAVFVSLTRPETTDVTPAEPSGLASVSPQSSRHSASHAGLPGRAEEGQANRALSPADHAISGSERAAEGRAQRPTPRDAADAPGYAVPAGAYVATDLERLKELRRRLESEEPLAREGDDGAWEGSEEQRALDLLLSLDLPQAEELALQWLMSSPSPRAVAELGLYLLQVAPGVHEGVVLAAAEGMLMSASSPGVVPGELFHVLGELGNAGTVGLLLDMPWHRDAYASVALASIRDGSGIDLLIQDARIFEQGRVTTHGRLAIELLAQEAHRDPGAAQVILDLAHQQLIPDDLWPDLIAAAAGRQRLVLVRPAHGLLAVHTILRPEGNQLLYRVAMPGSPDDFSPRVDFLEQLRLLAPRNRSG